jgi:hypothetical protein
MVSHVPQGSFSEGSWIGEMQQASDNSVIISEILDPRTKNLLSMSRISDYVLSNELVSMALAMVAEDRQINDVLEELFAERVRFLNLMVAWPITFANLVTYLKNLCCCIICRLGFGSQAYIWFAQYMNLMFKYTD